MAHGTVFRTGAAERSYRGSREIFERQRAAASTSWRGWHGKPLGYRSAWRGWAEWSALNMHATLPAESLAIAAYLADGARSCAVSAPGGFRGGYLDTGKAPRIAHRPPHARFRWRSRRRHAGRRRRRDPHANPATRRARRLIPSASHGRSLASVGPDPIPAKPIWTSSSDSGLYFTRGLRGARRGRAREISERQRAAASTSWRGRRGAQARRSVFRAAGRSRQPPAVVFLVATVPARKRPGAVATPLTRSGRVRVDQGQALDRP